MSHSHPIELQLFSTDCFFILCVCVKLIGKTVIDDRRKRNENT